MSNHEPVFLLWTKVTTPDGSLRTVKVFVDIDAALDVARRSVLNKSNRSKLGPVFAEALRGDVDIIGDTTKI